MICSDTGSTEAIHVSRETVELAQELQSVLGVIRTSGQGDGTITVKVSGASSYTDIQKQLTDAGFSGEFGAEAVEEGGDGIELEERGGHVGHPARKRAA